MPDGMGMPAPSWDSLVEETRAATRRRRRRRRQRWMLGLLALVTAGALAVIGLFVVRISKIQTAASPAALSASAPTASHATVPKTSRAAHGVSSGRSHPSAVTYPQVTDTASGLSYRRLSSPWRQSCPPNLITPMFNWSAGENTVAGHVNIDGSLVAWYGVACSGRLPQQFTYAGPADLEQTALSLAVALNRAYYSGIPHHSVIQDSTATQVSGHQAWMVEFMMHYPDGASQGLTWSTELGAVVVADSGPNQAPAVFYVSVPGNLGTLYAPALLFSLRIS
jgi:hypothetical protein